jgi:hypothetical protein
MSSVAPRGQLKTAQDTVLDLFYGRWRSQTLHAGVELGVFEVASAAPTSSARIAEELGLDPALAYRLLRALAALDVLREDDARSFALTDAGALLRADHPQSMRGALLLREGAEHTAIWKHLAAMVRDGRQDGFVREFGVPAFEHATRAPAYGAAFDAGMNSQSNLQTAWTLEALRDCDFSTTTHLCDIGGGQGHLLCHLLERYPHLRGTLFERPSVIERGPSPWAARLGVAERCMSLAGDMFTDAPAADAYTMKMILHDWNDAESMQILGHMRRRALPDARLFVIEHVIPDRGGPDYAALFDMHMLCWGTGKERTLQEYRDLLDAAGWSFVAVRYPQSGAIGVVEAVRRA